MKLVIFEDRQTDHFAPLCHLRGVFELRCGASRLSDKIARAAGVEASALIARDYLAASVAQRYPIPINQLTGLSGEVLFVNARVRGAGWDAPAAETACWQGDQLAAWRTTGDVSAIDGIDALYNAAKSANRAAYDGKWFDYIWDIMIANPEEITADFVAAGKQGLHGEMHETATIFGPKENLFIGDGASIHPFVCLDTREGPITIEKGCEVHPFTRIEGPCYLGEKSILLGAKVREGCSIGPMCRVGGEVEESIIHGYSNKYHDGFLGHAYVGEWVNLGALTSNSDLKNDYTSVSVMMGRQPVDTGSNKVGSFIGDHVKTSIGTLLNTGSVVGTMAILVATGAPLPKYIPAYAWFMAGAVTKGFGLNPLIKTAKKAMSRRKVELSEVDEALLRHVYELTAEERNAHVARARKTLVTR
jgi:UDP-N-acetylglucosamine diphosphorylase/glucosamine-1-phosphate N-acetyltransferase